MKLAATSVEEVNPIIIQGAKQPDRSAWLDDLEGSIQRLERRLDGMTRTASEMVAVAESTSTSAVNPDDLEKTIQLVGDLERSIGTDLERFRSEQEHWADLLLHHSTEARGRFSKLVEVLENAMARTAEAVRDARWRLLTIQAQIEEEGSAPVFDDPDALERYLGKR
jgi:hypothetical protein